MSRSHRLPSALAALALASLALGACASDGPTRPDMGSPVDRDAMIPESASAAQAQGAAQRDAVLSQMDTSASDHGGAAPSGPWYGGIVDTTFDILDLGASFGGLLW